MATQKKDDDGSQRMGVRRVKRLMYDDRVESLVTACGPVLANLLAGKPSGIAELVELAPDDAMRKRLLAYEAEMNARTAQALRVGLVVGRGSIVVLRVS